MSAGRQPEVEEFLWAVWNQRIILLADRLYDQRTISGPVMKAILMSLAELKERYSEFESAYLAGLREQVAADLSRLAEITSTMAAELAAARDRVYQRRTPVGGAFASWLGNVERDNESASLGAELAEAQQKIFKLIEEGQPFAEIYAITKPLVDRIANDKCCCPCHTCPLLKERGVCSRKVDPCPRKEYLKTSAGRQ